MRLSQRLIAVGIVVALSTVLAGCSSSMNNFDPSDLLDFLDSKKKLPGDRKPVFPEGVPGLEQGVPKELYKGSAQEKLDQQNAAQTAAAAPPPAEEPKAKKGKKTKQPATAAPDAAQEPAAAADPNAAPDANAPSEAEGAAAAAPPPPKPKKIVRKRTTAPPPPAAPGQQQSAAPFPAPMPSTFQR